MLSEWLKRNLVPDRHPIRSKTKTNYYSRANVFPRFAASATAFAPEFDWFIGLSVCFVIGQSDCFLVLVLRDSVENFSIESALLRRFLLYIAQ